ncbi:MAG: hypothetical protein C7B46_09010 [Sulfobacillus benefaciens]|uniref:Uncharacterized protein n=1 Tax=Sulfobacillus benefaciens TaxID=453960 RepID=A0A2T2XH15_9FIRM|nr:MAG: hypothetical protein C7B46_09010 [Sulfobacillus benefaciens]
MDHWESQIRHLTDAAPTHWKVDGQAIINKLPNKHRPVGSTAWGISLAGVLALGAVTLAMSRSTSLSHAVQPLAHGTISWSAPQDGVATSLAMTPLGPLAVKGTHIYDFNRDGYPNPIAKTPNNLQIAGTYESGLILTQTVKSNGIGTTRLYQYQFGSHQVKFLADEPPITTSPAQDPVVAGGHWLSIFGETSVGRPYTDIINLRTGRESRLSLLMAHQPYLQVKGPMVNAKLLGPDYPPQPVAIGNWGLVVENRGQWYRVPFNHPRWIPLAIPRSVSPSAPISGNGTTVSYILQTNGAHPLSWWVLNPETGALVHHKIPSQWNYPMVLYNVPSGPGGPDIRSKALIESIIPESYGLWISISQGSRQQNALIRRNGQVVPLHDVPGYWETSVDPWGALWSSKVHTIVWQRW